MAGIATRLKREASAAPAARVAAIDDPPWVRRLLICVAVGFLGLLLIAPLALVFTQAFARGWRVYVAALTDPDALAAIRLTLLVTVIVVPMNTAFGLAAGWALGKFQFRGRSLLTTLID